ncbi:hypothetical protein [Lactobacillus crispatus]|jgi:hypothetical protein|uniref:hypothetical protein n=1 Tax=Lactobacillus crispatus TaxID=47770 RepID=UPI0020646AAE|nr:hypothetical protein [Lactobacillus crispatus]WEB70107.1 hypothetical protein PUW69_05590 [Lactobacillus crispatus]DAO35305.1 MAG TPA: hypothetical protein [Caudoviricetes sp.]
MPSVSASKGLSPVFDRAKSVAKTMENREVKQLRGAKINGGNVAVYKARNGVLNVLGLTSSKGGMARYFTNGNQFVITPDAQEKYGFYQKAKKIIYKNNSKYKEGHTGMNI